MIASEHRLALPAGYQLGKYRFKGVLGAGGFGITYLAEDHSLGRRVAIKELLPNDIATRLDGTTVVAKTKSEESSLAWARERFVEEGRALAACEHPNVVHVYEMIEANGTAYMVTKFEEGRSMAEWLNTLGRKPTEAELRGLLEPLLSGLDKVHRAGFLHRDLKPENIYITSDGRPLLLDFGSARQAVSDRSALLTSIVTIGYAPFEQYYEDGKQGPWTDIYALAGVMYRSIHGEKPPEATRRLKNDTCIKVAKKYSGSYAAQFLNAIDKALAVEHQDRPQTVAAWRSMLGRGAAVEPEKTKPVDLPPRQDWREHLQQAWELVYAFPRAAASAAAVAVLLCSWLILKLLSPAPVPPGPTPGPTPNPGPVAIVTPSPIIKRDPTPTPAPIAIITPPPSTPPPFIPGPTPGGNPPGPDAQAVDTGIVGTWTTKVKMGGSNFIVLRWEQFADGHYASSAGGAPVDAGTLSAQDGSIRRTSNVTHMTVDVTYEVKSDNEIVTNDPTTPNGPVTWKRVGTGTASSKGKSTTHSRSSGGGESSSHSSGGGWQFNIPHNLPTHFPRPF